MQPLLVTMETLCRERAGKVTWPFKDLAGHLEICILICNSMQVKFQPRQKAKLPQNSWSNGAWKKLCGSSYNMVIRIQVVFFQSSCMRKKSFLLLMSPRTLAALADAHDEAFLVTRLADSDSFQPTDLMYALETWLGLRFVV